MRYELQRLIDGNDVAQLKLTDESRLAMEKMAAYMNVAKMGAFDREIVRRDMIAMALEAQEREEPFSSVIGEDQKAWCDEIAQSVGPAPLSERILHYIKNTAGWAVFLCILEFGTGREPAGITLGFLFLLALYCVFRYIWFTYAAPRLAYAKKWVRIVSWCAAPATIFALYILQWFFYGSTEPVPWTVLVLFHTAPIWITALFTALFLCGYIGYELYLYREAIRRGLSDPPKKRG